MRLASCAGGSVRRAREAKGEEKLLTKHTSAAPCAGRWDSSVACGLNLAKVYDRRACGPIDGAQRPLSIDTHGFPSDPILTPNPARVMRAWRAAPPSPGQLPTSPQPVVSTSPRRPATACSSLAAARARRKSPSCRWTCTRWGSTWPPRHGEQSARLAARRSTLRVVRSELIREGGNSG